ncbi:uncharacterized protein [Diadema antillarum]|uniref:uncharacterized protein n=1 Tax=Diadema antillarum TaxID=105358 RepID=UPI003A8A7E6C
MASVRRRSRRSLSAMDDFTPRTLIQGFLDTAQTVRQSPRKRARVTPGPSAASPAPIPASAQRRRSRTPGTLPRSARSSRRMTRLETLATPGGSDPTPRGLITGFLQAADVQTPAIYAKPRVSSPLKQPTPSVRSRNDIQAHAESSSTSSDLPVSDVAYRFARPRPDEGPRPRRRRAIDREEFASRVRERLSQEEEEEEEEEEDRMEQGEEEGERETTADRVLLESIAEDPSQFSLPRPDSTTRDQGETSRLGTTPSGRRRSSRRSLLQDSSLQVPSTSTQVSHQSFLSNEGDSLMMQVSQDTVRAHSTSSADTTGDDEEEGVRQSGSASRREEDEGTVDDRMGEEDAVEGTEEEEEEEEEEPDEDVDEDREDMDVRDDSREFFEDADVVAPTQPAHIESVKKRGASISSPLRTPHLRATGRRTTPAAKTPAAFRQAPLPTKRQPLHQIKTATRPPPGGKGPRTPKEPPTTLPRSLMRSIFSHFSTARISQEAIRSVEEVSSKYFKNISSDLLAYCKHAGRNTIDQADVELLMKRQRLVSDKEPLQIYIEKYLPMEYREELIPMARSGNRVYPRIAKK